MRIIRKSIARKAVLLFLLLGGALYGGYELTKYYKIDVYDWPYILGGVGLLLFLVLLTFLVNIYRPLKRLTKEVRSLLTGNKYQRVSPTTVDEVGVLTHFFNEITKDLEKISADIKESKRMSSELDIAAQIQKEVLPKEAPEAPGLDVVAKTRAAAEVGGDNFDFVPSIDGNQLFIYIGDVTGHGVPAGLIMMMVDTLVSTLAQQGVDNGRDLIAKTNEILTPRISTKLFMTSVMLRWDKVNHKMYFTGAGHEYVLVYRAKSETVESIASGGIALGMIPDVSKIVKETEIPLEVGDSIVLYTDGITEARDETDKMYDLESLVQSLKSHGYRPSAESIFDHLTKDFSDFVGEYVQNDDITMIVIKYVGKNVPISKVKLTIAKDQDANEVDKKKNWDWEG